MTDIENLQKKENAMEEAQSQRELKIVGKITELFMQLSPGAKGELLDRLLEEEIKDEAH